MSPANTPVDAQLLSAWVDGALDAEQSAQVQAWLAEHPEDAHLVQQWKGDAAALRERLAPLGQEPVPHAVLELLQPVPAANTQRWRHAAIAAGLLVAGGVIGAVLMQQSQQRGWATAPQPSSAMTAASSTAEWVHRAAVAHAVYTPEVRHPVEVNTDQGTLTEQRANEEHLSRWLTKRLAMPVKLFDLRAQGFELVGGRLLPDINSPSAQLMYQAAGGKRVTVYLRKPEASTPAAFSFERQGELSLFYWVDGPTGYALVGTLPREQLLAMAESIYRQGQAAAAAAASAKAASAATTLSTTPSPTSSPKTP